MFFVVLQKINNMNIEKLSKNETDIFLNTYRDNVIKFLDDIEYGESIKVLINDWNHAFHAQIHPTTYITNKSDYKVKCKMIGMYYIIKKVKK